MTATGRTGAASGARAEGSPSGAAKDGRAGGSPSGPAKDGRGGSPSGAGPGGGPAGTTPREAAYELGRAYKGCVGAMRRMRGRETHRHDELSDAQYGLLFGLRESGPMATSELALLADLSPASATEMLEALAAAGLVSRVRSERDRRVVLTSLTDRGHELVDERHARFAPRFEAALAEFSDRELRTAARVLHGLARMFDSIRPGEAGPAPDRGRD